MVRMNVNSYPGGGAPAPFSLNDSPRHSRLLIKAVFFDFLKKAACLSTEKQHCKLKSSTAKRLPYASASKSHLRSRKCLPLLLIVHRMLSVAILIRGEGHVWICGSNWGCVELFGNNWLLISGSYFLMETSVYQSYKQDP